MYTLKSIAQRSTMLGAVFALVAAAFIPAAAVFADALNPLTERSLLLSSSAPGFQDTDGSGYSTAVVNPASVVPGSTAPGTYAPAGSGANGKKTGETFTFRVSSDTAIKGMSLQYCTKAAGDCVAPGNNPGDADPDNDGNEGEAGDATDTSSRVANTDPTAHAAGKSDLDVVGSFSASGDDTPTSGEFAVLVNGTQTSGWTMSALNAENDDLDNTVAKTGKNNMIHLVNSAGSAAVSRGDKVQVIFKASENTYITNPGDDEFFVKINTYKTGSAGDFIPTVPYTSNSNIIDGGVTVANVMTDSIHITTKVLETMSFSVGTQNPDTTNLANHGTCDTILQNDGNRLSLGNQSAEYSLEVNEAYDVNSYWRLSSNSSGGASVYYSGDTLSNTVGDQIADMPTRAASDPGTEQFGLGFVDAGADTDGTGIFQAGRQTPRSYPFITLDGQAATAPYNSLAPQDASDAYSGATGTLSSANAGPGTAEFSFKKSSSTVPELIAQQNDDVISCATAKMRYVGNIAADTPAGVYTTKVNYLAAPQY